jgi:hypothetical protein
MAFNKIIPNEFWRSEEWAWIQQEALRLMPNCADCGTKEKLIVRIGSANFRRYQAGLKILPEKCTVICESCLLKRQK